jgi:hypothetical protein
MATNTLDASDLTVSTHDMGLRISHRICAGALRALLLAKMSAADQHDRSACRAEAMQLNMLRSVLVA